MLWVVDATGVAEIFRIMGRRRDIEAEDVRERLAEAVGDGEICFPDSVCADLKRLERKESVVCMWLDGVKSERAFGNPLLGSRHFVGLTLAELVDYDAPPRCHADVAALAHELAGAGRDVTVVTEDRRDRTRMSLVTACFRMSVKSVSAAEFVAGFFPVSRQG